MWSRPWWQGGWVAGCSVVVRVVVLVVADPPQVEEGDAHALEVRAAVDSWVAAADSWVAAAPMPTFRYVLGVAALGGKIYAAGGQASLNGSALSTVEAYNPQTNTWAAIAPMGTPRKRFGLVAVRGKLYAVGGYTGSAGLATAEAYNPQTDRWEVVAPMSSARSSPAFAAM